MGRTGRKRMESMHDDNEWCAYNTLARRGETEVFYLDEPLRLLIMQEDAPGEEQRRQEELDAAERLTRLINADLTPRQRAVLKLRAEELTFEEIASALACSERSVFYDWKVIRAVAHRRRAEQ